MIKIVNKEEYNNLLNKIRHYERRIVELGNEDEKTKKILLEISKHLDEVVTENELLKKEKITLKSKITRLENQAKKMQEEENKRKKLVKETLKEVHKEHKKRVTKKEEN